MTTKDQLINFLSESRGNFISGGMLAKKLGITRAAVSKHVKRLTEAGFRITSVTGKGYCFHGESDSLLPSVILSGLKTSVFGKGEIRHYDEILSTNTSAMEMAVTGSAEGALVIAEHQSAGKGRKGRFWHSDRGKSISLSMILRPFMVPEEAQLITLLTGITVAETLKKTVGINAVIKWPNDVYVNGRKITGILTEIGMETDQVDYMVVGAGINVYQNLSDFPAELREKATSVILESETHRDEAGLRPMIVRDFLKRFEKAYIEAKRNGFGGVLKAWEAMDWLKNKPVSVDMIRKSFTGRAVGIDETGALLVDAGSEIRRVFSGDVQPL